MTLPEALAQAIMGIAIIFCSVSLVGLLGLFIAVNAADIFATALDALAPMLEVAQ